MGRQMPWDDIPDSNVFPTGVYHVQGVKMEEKISGNGKLMYAVDVSIMEHPATALYTNMHFFENIVIGTEDDPLAEVPGTWTKGFGIKYKQLITKSQIAEKHDLDKQCASFPGVQFLVAIQEFKEPAKTRDGQENPYAGQPRNKSNRYYKISEKEPSIDKKPGVGPGAAPAVAPQAPPTLAQAAPVTPPAPAQVNPALVAAAAAPAPPVVATPVAPVAPAAPGQMLACTVCGTQVPAAEFAGHIQACLAKQG